MRKAAGVCIVLLTITACSTKRTYLEKGNAFFQQGKYDEATINYQKAIQKDTKYGEAYYRLGLTAEKQNKSQDAYNALFRASRLLPNDVEVKEKFAGLCLQYYLRDITRPAKLYQQVEQSAAELLARNPNSFEGLRLKGYLAYADRKPQEAMDYFRKALQVRPDSGPVTTALVQTLAENGQIQEGEKLALDLLKRQKDYGPLYDALARIYSGSNRTSDADNILRSKIENNPKNIEYILQVAAYYANDGRTSEMKSTLQRVLDDPKDFPTGQLRVGDFYLRQKDYSDAIPHYEEGGRAHPNAKVLYQQRALAALLTDKKYEDANRLVNEILKENPKDEVALRIRADLLINAGGAENATAALAILQDELNENPNDVNPALRLQLGRAYRNKGDLDSARAQFSEALRMRRVFPAAQYELAEISLQQNRPAEAQTQAEKLLARNPKDQRARLLHARSLAASGNAAGAREELTKLLKDFPQDLEARLQLGSLAFQQRQYSQAIETLRVITNSGDPRVFAGLVASYARAGQIDKAVEVANEGLKRVPNSRLIQEELADSAALAGKLDLAISEFQKLIASNPKSVETHVRLGAVYDMKGDQTDAIRMFQKAHDIAPNELGPALTLANALAQAGRRDEAKEVYRTTLGAHPNDATVLNNTAYFLCESGGDLDEALRLAQTAVQKMPNQPGFADTLGYVYLKKGQHDSAIQTFSGLVRKYPAYPTFHYHLGLALYEAGDRTRAKKELRDSLATHPSARDAVKIKQLLARAG